MTAHPLLMLLGEWRGEETIEASQWGADGTALAHVRCRAQLDGKILVQDYVAEREGKVWLRAHAIFSLGDPSGACSLFWFDSLGFAPEQPAPGHWDGQALSFVRRSPRGQTRHTYTALAEGGYAMKLESSFDGGARWIAVMQGRYARAANATATATDEQRSHG